MEKTIHRFKKELTQYQLDWIAVIGSVQNSGGSHSQKSAVDESE